MAYFIPYIDSTGFHMPTYADILDSLTSSAKTIFGQDIYLGEDSQDYQFMSAVASKIYDSFLTAQSVYNSYGPSTSVGTALDTVVKINGIRRIGASYSTCNVTLSGTPNTVINNGKLQDNNNILWDLPTTVTLDNNGSATVSVQCEQTGAVIVGTNSFIIATPLYGWMGVTNTANVNVGTDIEADSALRSRQAQSTSLSSLTVLDSLKAMIMAVQGVSRSQAYENFTNTTDSNGLPAHSVTCVVEGGTDYDVANAIYLKRGIGPLTNGTTSVEIEDQYSQLTNISFYRPSYVDVDITINVKKLNNYTSQTSINIQNAVANFLNSFSIGNSLSNSGLWGAALSSMQSLNNPTFSITSITDTRHGSVQSTQDIALAFNEVLRGNASYITVNAS